MKAPSLGLVGAGALGRSFLCRLPALRDRLGPVLATSYRLASRLVNSLDAGYPIEQYQELDTAQIILIAVPDYLLPDVLAGLVAAELDWRQKLVILCESREDCTAMAPLARRGAGTASLGPIPGLSGHFIVEGERRAVREAKRLFRDGAARVHELACGGKGLFMAALTFSGSLLLPVADAAARCLRAAGLPAAATNAINGALLEKARRAYLHAGRKAFGGVLADRDEGEVARELAALEHVDPSLAEAYRVLARLAMERFERDATWLEEAFRLSRRFCDAQSEAQAARNYD